MAERSSDPGPPTTVRIESRQRNGHRCTLIGEIDHISNVADTEAALVNSASSATPLTLDLAALSYLDSQGIAMLFRLAAFARREGGSLRLANPQVLFGG
jgi:anti-anti-sigma factor